MMNMILLGAPGSGKGTHAPGLSERYGSVPISSGDIFRKQLKDGTPLGLKAKQYMDRGELVPDELVIEIVLSRLEEADVKEKGFILDGFPRTQEQAAKLDEYLKNTGRTMNVALCLDVKPEVVIKRLSGRRVCRNCGATYNLEAIPSKKPGICDHCSGPLYQRDDDKEATVRNRLEVYERQTAGLIAYYAARGNLVRVDGSLPREESFRKILEAMAAVRS